jgi:hypothetical protein
MTLPHMARIWASVRSVSVRASAASWPRILESSAKCVYFLGTTGIDAEGQMARLRTSVTNSLCRFANRNSPSRSAAGVGFALLRAGVFVFAQISLLPVILACSLDKQKLTFGC